MDDGVAELRAQVDELREVVGDLSRRLAAAEDAGRLRETALMRAIGRHPANGSAATGRHLRSVKAFAPFAALGLLARHKAAMGVSAVLVAASGAAAVSTGMVPVPLTSHAGVTPRSPAPSRVQDPLPFQVPAVPQAVRHVPAVPAVPPAGSSPAATAAVPASAPAVAPAPSPTLTAAPSPVAVPVQVPSPSVTVTVDPAGDLGWHHRQDGGPGVQVSADPGGDPSGAAGGVPAATARPAGAELPQWGRRPLGGPAGSGG